MRCDGGLCAGDGFVAVFALEANYRGTKSEPTIGMRERRSTAPTIARQAYQDPVG